MTALNPYLTFDGNCEAAFNFYKSVFGGEFPMIMRFKDAPPEHALPGDEGEKIMHIALPIGNGNILMGSDSPQSMGPLVAGNNFSISVSTSNEEENERLFNGLSAGGQVLMPLAKTFWGAYFGMLNDKFGIRWMVSYEYNKK